MSDGVLMFVLIDQRNRGLNSVAMLNYWAFLQKLETVDLVSLWIKLTQENNE